MSNFIIALIIAVVSDAVMDILLLIGLIPIVGDILDLATSFILYRYIGSYALISGGELIPALDILPFHTASVIAWRFLHKGAVAA